MSLNEFQAQQVMLVRALEQSRDNGGLWSAGDAKEATRATRELVGSQAPLDQFAARRAEFALAALRQRTPQAMPDLPAPRWPTIAGGLLVGGALLLGFVTDHFVAERRVNVVEYPLVGLILWNLLIFIAILWRRLAGLLAPHRKHGGMLTDLIARWQLRSIFSGFAGKQAPWLARFRREWLALAAPLNEARLALALHLAALCFALGALASLYVRGFFMEYRAVWESTFFAADSIHAIASVVLAPGALLLNVPVPDAAHIATLRIPGNPGEIASGWIHLYAASILAWIILPRGLLALANRFAVWRLRRAFPLPLQGSYFTTLRAMRSGSTPGVLVIPCRYELTPQIKSNLAKLLERALSLAVEIVIRQPVLADADAQAWSASLNSRGNDDPIAVLVIFNLTATAESEVHGRLLARIMKAVGNATPVIALVDTSSYPADDVERWRARCAQWRQVLDAIRCQPLFLDLANAEDADVLDSLAVRLNAQD
jgi:hypothetical protein